MFITKLQNLQNVVAGSVAIIPSLPMGLTYYGLVFKLGGTFTKAQIDYIRLRLAGKQFIDVTGSHLTDQLEYLGETSSATYFMLPFAEPNAKTVVGEMKGAIDTSIYDRQTVLEMEVKINSGATSPTLECWGLMVPPKGLDQDLITAIQKSEHNVTSAGKYDRNIPIGSQGGALIRRIFVHHDGNLDIIHAKKDGVDILEDGEEALLDYIQSSFYRTAQADVMCFDFTLNNNQSDSIATLRADARPAPFEFQFETANAGGSTFTTYSVLYARIQDL